SRSRARTPIAGTPSVCINAFDTAATARATIVSDAPLAAGLARGPGSPPDGAVPVPPGWLAGRDGVAGTPGSLGQPQGAQNVPPQGNSQQVVGRPRVDLGGVGQPLVVEAAV